MLVTVIKPVFSFIILKILSAKTNVLTANVKNTFKHYLNKKLYMEKFFSIVASLLAAMAVILGAFGAHGLKVKITEHELQIFETGVKYQFYHIIALFVIAWLVSKYPDANIFNYAGYCFMVGIFCFLGSLYLLATKNLLGLTNWQWLGPVTPFGGLFFIVGWLLIALGVYMQK